MLAGNPCVASRVETMNRLAVAFCAVTALLAPAARASQQAIVAARNWKEMDLCAKQAQAAFPDFTPTANAKRDASLKECLERKNLPPRGAPSSQ
jgi:hypothetical protein